MTVPAVKIQRFQKKLLAWYRVNGRHELPWRKNPTPYRVLVSEVMLQQTQVSRVIPKYYEFIKTFPTLKALAVASPASVLRLWSGLGYNRRALMLLRCAQVAVVKHRARLPDTYDALVALPGIGRYTAHAVNVFARNRNEVCVDTNVRRVLIAELGLSARISDSDLEKVALAALPKSRAREWHSALMDYGSLVATVRTTGVRPKGPKQSTFQGSERQVRGAIVRALTDGKSHTVLALVEATGFPEARVLKNITALAGEGIVEAYRGRYRLSR